MCTQAYNVQSDELVTCIGDLRKIAPIVFFTKDWAAEESSKLPDDCCLCPVDVLGTLVFAGFKVWRNPEMLPELLFEPVTQEVA